jgi:Kinesin motor domain
MPTDNSFDVYARLRPAFSSGKISYSVKSKPDDSSLLIIDQQEFLFKRVFGPESSQVEVFESVALPLIQTFLSGINSCIFCYGMTNAGKTFTTSGSSTYESRGIIPRSIEYVMSHLGGSNDPDNYSIRCSFLEIYNEVAYDLLADQIETKWPIDNWPKVQIGEDLTGAVVLKGLSCHEINNIDEAVDFFIQGNNNRMISSTPLNQASTRSHCIFTLDLEIRDPLTSIVKKSHFNIVDLAGSERAWKTGLEHQVLSESKYINRSLHFLEQVITALAKKSSHIPYRNSLLTSVLRESLGGNAKTAMIANLGLERAHLGESLATARFAQRCAQLENHAVVNEQVDYKFLAEKLQAENHRLLEELQSYKNDIRQLPVIAPQPKPVPESPPASLPECSSKTLIDGRHTNEAVSVRDVLNRTGLNLIKHPKDVRKRILSEILDQGLDIKINCTGDVCLIVQVLLAKLEQISNKSKILS